MEKGQPGRAGLFHPLAQPRAGGLQPEKDLDAALGYYQKAIAADPDDPRLLLEYDYLLHRKAIAPEERLALLESKRDVVDLRDDLVIHLIGLYNRAGQPEKALQSPQPAISMPGKAAKVPSPGSISPRTGCLDAKRWKPETLPPHWNISRLGWSSPTTWANTPGRARTPT